jgi:two-component system LytT family sensor kinase
MKFALHASKKRQVIYHVAAWVIFIAYEVSFVTLIRGVVSNVSAWGGYIVPYIINISFFYFHALVTMSAGFGKRPNRISLFILLVLLELCVYLFTMQINDWVFLHHPFSLINPAKIKFIQQLWRGIYFLIFSTAYWLIQRSFINEQKLKQAETKALLQQQEKKEMELKLISAQNAFLQSQINPHLLFNTLNFIHSEVEPHSEKASEAIIILSDMMRYSISDTKTDGKVLLEKEIGQIENLIRINQFRFDNKLCINLVTEGEFGHIRIIPLLLVPFVENVFKYAEITDGASPVQISIQLSDNKLHFQTFNKKRRKDNFRSPGIGIDNINKRLLSYYPDRFVLDIIDSEATFSVGLKIEL